MAIIVRSERLDNLAPMQKKTKWQSQNHHSRLGLNWAKDISAKVETKIESKVRIGKKAKSSTMPIETDACLSKPTAPPLPPYLPLRGLQELFKEVGGPIEPEQGSRDSEVDEAVSPVTITARSCVGTMGDSIDDRLCEDSCNLALSPTVTVTTIDCGSMLELHGAACHAITRATSRASTISPLHSNHAKRQTIYLTLDNSNQSSPDLRVQTPIQRSASSCSATTCTSYPWSPTSCGEETPRNLSPKVAVTGPFSLVKAVEAAAFDEFRPHNPIATTLKRRPTINESKMKALPPYPPLPPDEASPSPDSELLLLRRSNSLINYTHNHNICTLPQNPQDSDFNMLNNTFNHASLPRHCRNMAWFPSLQRAAADLEAHLSTIHSAKESQPQIPSPSSCYSQSTADSQQDISPVLSSTNFLKKNTSQSSIDQLRESIAQKQKFQLSRSPRWIQTGLKRKWGRLSTFNKQGEVEKRDLRRQLPPLQTAQQSSTPKEELDFGLNMDLEIPAGIAELHGEGMDSAAQEYDSSIYTDEAVPDSPKALPECIIRRVFENVGHFDELFNLAMVDRSFYRYFKQNELTLVKDTLSQMSLPAWELREMSPPWNDQDGTARFGGNTPKDEPVPEYTPRLYLEHYSRDLYTLVALKSMILVNCESFLRLETSRALAGLDEKRSAEMDDAFWRVWTFCKLFGCGKGREGDIEAQVDWLRGGVLAESDTRPSASLFSPMMFVSNLLLDPPEGFAKGNCGGLTAEQLCDMSEVWTCLVALLDVFHGKCKEARKYGVFDDKDVKLGDVTREEVLLEEWTRYLLTLGPSAVLTLVSFSPSAPIEQRFARAKALGWTKWSSPFTRETGSSRLFFKEAVSRACLNLGSRPSSFSSSQQTSSPSNLSQSLQSKRSSRSSVESLQSARRQRRAGFAAELRKKKVSLDTGLGISDVKPPCDERPTPTSEAVFNRFICSESGTPYLSPPPGPVSPTTTIKPAASTPSHKKTPSSSSAASSSSSSSSSSPPLLSKPVAQVMPVEEKISQGRQPITSTHPPRYRPTTEDTVIRDPADLALQKMIHELGFSEKEAKWALKRTDTGESVDINAAVHLLLVRASKKSKASLEGGLRSRESSIPQTKSDKVYRPTWRWA